MNPGQEMFYNFLMERTMEDKKEEAKTLLEDCFEKQNNGTFNHQYLEGVMPKLFAIVKPEATDELKAAMNNFASKL